MASPLRIAAFGNCQLDGVVKSVRLLNGDIEARSAYTTAESVAKLDLSDCDKVVAQYHSLILEKMASRPDDLVLYPRVYVEAFQPDCVYVAADGKWVQSPLGDYNSAIAVHGFLNGLSETETVALFNERTYERLGYYALWEADRTRMIGEGRITGHDVGPALERWMADGAFMHTVNHPKLHVLADIADGRSAVGA